MSQIPIEVNLANMLHYAGSIYRNPMDAVKEFTSNAIDAFREEDLVACNERLTIRYELRRNEIIISYNAPGMSEREWKAVLKRVADSLKRESDKPHIGLRGIGNFSFMQVGKAAEFLHKKTDSSPTVKVVLRDGHSKADVTAALKREELPHRGVKVRIYELKVKDPTSSRSPLAAHRLSRYLTEKFDAFLRDGWLSITVVCGNRTLCVEPMQIKLPPIAKDYRTIYINGSDAHRACVTLWFDPYGKGMVRIRHAGVPIVDDMRMLENGYGIEESIFTSGYVFGYVDADFLQPLATRNGFEEGKDWDAFLEALDRMAPAIEAEIEQYKSELKLQESRKIYEKAIKLARELLSSPELQSLDWFESGQKISQRPPNERTGKKPRDNSPPDGSRSHRPSDTPGGKRIAFQVEPFPEGPALHSNAVVGQHVTLRVNSLNQDYIGVQTATEKAQTYYFARLINKEVIAYNDETGVSDASLEYALTAEFQLRKQLGM